MAATTPAQGMTPLCLVRKLLLGLLGLVGLALLMLVIVPYIVSLDSIKGQIVAHLEAALQRQVDVGAVRLQLLSGLGAGLEDVTIYNSPGWQQPYLMKAGRLSVKVAWRPLLRRQVEITQMLLSDGEIIIERDAQGRLNIADHAVSTPESTEILPAEVQRSTDGEETQARSNLLEALSVSEVSLQKMQITFVDHLVVPGQETITTLNDIRLRVQDVTLGTPMPIELIATMSTDGSQNIRLHGSVGPVAENMAVESIPIDIYLRATDVHLDKFTPYLSANVPLSQGRLAADVTVEGSIDSSLHLTNTLSLADAMLREESMRDVLRVLPMLTSTQDITIDLRTGQAELTDVTINVAGVQATIKGMVHKLTTIPELDLRVATNTFAPGALLTQLPGVGSLLLAPTDLHGTVQLQATLTGTPHDLHSEAQVDLHEIALRSGAFNGGAQGNGGVLLETDKANVRLVTQVVNANPPHVHVDAGVQRLSFDRQETHTPAPAPNPQSEPATETPPSQPRRPPIILSGRVSVAEGHLRNLNFQHMAADFHLSDWILKTTQQMTLYGGSYQGAMQVDLASSEPSYILDATCAGLDVGQMVNELTPARNVVLGVLDTDMRLVGRGTAWDVINKTLSGNGSVKITEAQLTSIDLLPKLGQLLREVGGLVGLTISKAWEPHAFRTIEGDWRLHQGKILTDHLRLRGEGVEALLKGYVGLDQSIEYAGDVFLPAQFSARRGAPRLLHQNEAGRVVVPFTVKGTVTEPRISISEKALANLAQEELADTIRKRLGGKIEGILGKPSAPDQQRQESDQPSQETGDQPQRQNLPGKILRELFRR
jgi:hypothetical protein